MTSLQRIAYGRPKAIKGWPIVDVSTNVGIRFFQITRARPFVFGYRSGRR